MARFFFVLSRILFASMLIMAFISPVGAQEQNVTTCVEDEEDDLLRCTVWVNEFGGLKVRMFRFQGYFNEVYSASQFTWPTSSSHLRGG